MRQLKHASLTAAVALLATTSIYESANAQAIYSGGGTLASRVYRQLFDCWGVPVNTAISPVPAGCSSTSGDVGGLAAQALYAPVGSGAGKRAFTHNDGSSSTSTGLGTPATTNTVPFTSTFLPAYGYPDFHFAGSDDVLSASDIATYNSVVGTAHAGAIIQLPALITTVTIPFNGKDGAGNPLNIVNAIPPGGSSGLNLSRQALCGIFSGHITQWNNPILTALNGGTVLGTGNITVVHRSDGSGTTFLTTNALAAQCVSQFGPTNETNSTLTLYEFPWSDRTVATTQCPALPFRGTNQANWPDLATDQCGNAIPNPGAGHFASASGSGGVEGLVASTNGAIGYVSPDFAQPILVSGPATANLQDQFDLDNGTGTFEPPTAANAVTAMSSAVPNFPGTSITNPLNWSAQGVVPNPNQQGAYAISGFTWLDFYQCYDSAGDLNALFSLLSFHYANPQANSILNANGFASIPGSWLNAAVTLVTASSSSMGTAGSGACSAVSPGA